MMINTSFLQIIAILTAIDILDTINAKSVHSYIRKNSKKLTKNVLSVFHSISYPLSKHTSVGTYHEAIIIYTCQYCLHFRLISLRNNQQLPHPYVLRRQLRLPLFLVREHGSS